MRVLIKLFLPLFGLFAAAVAPAAVRYDIAGTWNFTINGRAFTNVQMDLVGIGTGAHHSVSITTPAGPLTLDEYDLSSLYGYVTGGGTINFGPTYSFQTAIYEGDGAVAFGNAESNDTIFATTIDAIYDGISAPFSANGVQGLSADEVSTALNNQFQITAASDVTFSTSYVPEPASWILMALGFGAVGFARRRSAGRASLNFA